MSTSSIPRSEVWPVHILFMNETLTWVISVGVKWLFCPPPSSNSPLHKESNRYQLYASLSAILTHPVNNLPDTTGLEYGSNRLICVALFFRLVNLLVLPSLVRWRVSGESYHNHLRFQILIHIGEEPTIVTKNPLLIFLHSRICIYKRCWSSIPLP